MQKHGKQKCNDWVLGVLDKNPDFCCVMFSTNNVTNSRKGQEALGKYEQNNIFADKLYEVIFG